jgi:NADPH:quinone reductase-like Zn-dependent oxidoreductase
MAATSLNPIDAKSRDGGGAAPALGDLPVTIGWDVAGVVEAVGDGVDELAVGQRVFGMPCFPREAAAYATHTAVPAAHLALVPAGMDDLTAGVLPLAGLTGLAAARDLAGLTPGQRVLIRGAGGGVGHLTVQIAKLLGATVVAVVNPAQTAFARDLGADEVLDRSAVDGDGSLADAFDAVIDLIGGPYLKSSVALTRPGGVVVCVPGGMDVGLDDLAAKHDVRAARTSVRPDQKGLEMLARWHADGLLSTHIGEVFELDDIVAAHRRLGAGGLCGKVAIDISSCNL